MANAFATAGLEEASHLPAHPPAKPGPGQVWPSLVRAKSRSGQVWSGPSLGPVRAVGHACGALAAGRQGLARGRPNMG